MFESFYWAHEANMGIKKTLLLIDTIAWLFIAVYNKLHKTERTTNTFLTKSPKATLANSLQCTVTSNPIKIHKQID